MSKKRKDKESMRVRLLFWSGCVVLVNRIQSQEPFLFFLTEKGLFKEKEEWRNEKKREVYFLTALATVIEKDSTMRKQANELKVRRINLKRCVDTINKNWWPY